MFTTNACVKKPRRQEKKNKKKKKKRREKTLVRARIEQDWARKTYLGGKRERKSTSTRISLRSAESYVNASVYSFVRRIRATDAAVHTHTHTYGEERVCRGRRPSAEMVKNASARARRE